ncbi:hypothetical protein [Arthrobacter crystallopoietes]|uniref:hypothetical protein n=1 Tax=Crystallibacter crystallopoietes TaxID=37928 RepID=UPI001FCE279A|nr:hypothetical protein [Arthrobacter crystallopoietes]
MPQQENDVGTGLSRVGAAVACGGSGDILGALDALPAGRLGGVKQVGQRPMRG